MQQTLDDISPALVDTTFVVVDLETTGGSSSEHRITEIGAVKVRAGQVLGEFQTLVNPATPIPAFIAVLTGITDSMVATAPSESEAVPAFLEFAAGSVLVAHNAGFDIGFLKAACERLGLDWPGPQVLDTVRLARQAAQAGGTAPAVYNAANEVAVAEFLGGRLPFPSIVDTVAATLDAHEVGNVTTLDDVEQADAWARDVAARLAHAGTAGAGAARAGE